MHFIARKKIPWDERGLLSSIAINVTENRDQVCATTYIAAADRGQALQPANAVTTVPQTLGVHESVLRCALKDTLQGRQTKLLSGLCGARLSQRNRDEAQGAQTVVIFETLNRVLKRSGGLSISAGRHRHARPAPLV